MLLRCGRNSEQLLIESVTRATVAACPRLMKQPGGEHTSANPTKAAEHFIYSVVCAEMVF